jgi:hypothetical protein
MIEIYCRLIIQDRRPFERVPDIFKEAVEARLKELGYDTNGDRIVNV